MDYRGISRDPIIDMFFAEVERAGVPLSFVSQKTGISMSTFYAWRTRTKRPQHITV